MSMRIRRHTLTRLRTHTHACLSTPLPHTSTSQRHSTNYQSTGEFGVVFKGVLRLRKNSPPEDVAVKTVICSGMMSSFSLFSFATLCRFPHNNNNYELFTRLIGLTLLSFQWVLIKTTFSSTISVRKYSNCVCWITRISSAWGLWPC